MRWRGKKLRVFQDLGIPGPQPHFMFGNILEYNKKGPRQCYEEWIAKYGKIVGFYHGLRPVLLVADPELLKKIFIKDFNLFSERPEGVPLRVHTFLDHIIPASKIMDNLLINLKGERWKEVRSILSPTFSANKLKMMIPAVNEVTEIALKILEKKSATGNSVDIYEILQRLTLDLICAQAFAMNTDSLNNPSDPLLRSAKIIFDLPLASNVIFFGRCFPELSFFAMAYNFLSMFIRNEGNIPPLKITKVVEVLIKQRRKYSSMRKPDLLQLLIDASAPNEDQVEHANNKVVGEKLKLTDLEIQSNALVVFLAGYETTSSALAYFFHFLAKYPDLQKKIQAEIDQLMEKEGELNYYNVRNFQLIDRFLLETMRFHPPAVNFIWRVAATDVDYGDVFIPKGMEINVAVDYIHHSAEFFENPEEFDPDRFLNGNSTKNQSVNYWAFGVGPRMCIGTRLVHLTAKIVLAKILHKFTVEAVSSHDEVCH
ncbi:hypothetical protein JTE90_009228 [Oedothorax gibbosus]|uniref:Cytochrome P450 n=1 Tax=Oedothorax gibbosus TaxID=931172 RepID=A0AAV6UQN9_9ARAC|nr:hypothetical protein JTE90_009228 [Oedothorax gibbosus]